MTIDMIGATAFIIAGARALESRRTPPLFSDPYAHLFVDEAWQRRTADFLDIHAALGEAVRLRTRAFNSLVEAAFERGVGQIVTLGCGFDMRHAIYGRDGVRFFDVDQSPVLEFKASVLEQACMVPCIAVACNYLEAGLPAHLVGGGLDPDEDILFIWEGNTMYLPFDRMLGFFDGLCDRLTRFQIAFDYFPQSVLDGRYDDAEAVDMVADLQKVLGVKFLTGFDTLEPLATDLPFRIVDSGNILRGGLDNSRLDVSLAAHGLSDAFAACYRIAVIERCGPRETHQPRGNPPAMI